MVEMSSPAEPMSLTHCSWTCNMTAGTWSLKAVLGNRRSCISSLILVAPQQAVAGAQSYRSAKKAMMGIVEILHVGINITGGVTRRNTMRAFHFTVGHFISLNSIGSEKCMSKTHLFP